jgi:hypothetical protein
MSSPRNWKPCTKKVTSNNNFGFETAGVWVGFGMMTTTLQGSTMILNARDTITRFLLSLARTPLLYYPYYRSHLPWPSQILIENTNCCNAQCVMCPRDTLTRKRGFMEFALFEKIMTELSGARRKPVVHLHGFGEPLLDPLLPERIRLAKACGIKQTYIVTNASLLFPETARSLIDAGLDAMKISFYGTDEASYNATMRQLDFKVALQNIKDFMRIRKELKKRTNPKLILQYLPQESNGAKTEEFQSLWRSLPDKKEGRLPEYQLFGQLWRREVVQHGGRKDSVCLFLPLVSPVGALGRPCRDLLR